MSTQTSHYHENRSENGSMLYYVITFTLIIAGLLLWSL